jgi:hypothetical protein
MLPLFTLRRNDRGRRQGALAVSAVVVLLTACVLRLAYVAESRVEPDLRTPTPGLDIDLHWQAAGELLAHAAGQPPFALMMTSSIGHPLFLAASRTVLGDVGERHRQVRAVLFSVTPVLLGLAAFLITSRLLAAVATGLAAATMPSLVYFDTVLLKVAPEMCALSLSLVLVLAATRGGVLRWPWRLALACGVLLGAVLLSQGGGLFYAFVVAGYLLTLTRTAWRVRLSSVLLLLAVVLTCGWLRPHLGLLVGIRAPTCLPVSGIHAAIGNHAGASGTYSALPAVPNYPYGHTFVSRLVAEVEQGRALTPEQANAYYWRQAYAFCSTQPGAAVALWGRKVRLLFGSFEPKDNHFWGDLERRSRLLHCLPVRFGTVLMFASLGAWSLWASGKKRVLLLLLPLLLAVAIANLVTFVNWRYRLPLLVPLLPLAGAGVAELVSRARCWRVRAQELWHLRLSRALPPVLLIAATALLTFAPVGADVVAVSFRKSEVNRRHSLQAETLASELGQLARVPALTAAQQWRKVRLLRGLERHGEAFVELRELIKRGPAPAAAGGLYLEYLAWLGEREQAVQFWERHADDAEQIKPSPLVHAWLDVQARTPERGQ